MASNLSVGVVIIGRNEGERLVHCLASVPGDVGRIVYVDSGSTDDSLIAADEAGAVNVELDMSVPFTAARARNAGLKILENDTETRFVQFLDGDCRLVERWLDTAREFMSHNESVGAVCGRRRETAPESSIYNRLCDREWDTPVGQTKACGGDVLMRISALKEVGGYRESMIAGEEPELCVRLRAAGWMIWRLDADMTLHDAAMTRFDQWWKRSVRSGHAFAEGADLHGAAPERHSVEAVTRIIRWGIALPIMILLLAVFVTAWALILLLVYPLQVLRLAWREGAKHRFSWERAFFLVLGNIPEALGVIKYHINRLLKKPAHLIEYK